MSILKCKMCGGTLEIADNQTTAVCEYCGTKQTLSKTTDEVIQNLYNRANNLRLKSEFDKAQEIYEKIIASDSSDAEAYWGIVLCKYGIEYVEDPKTFKRVPTCHRTQIESVLSDIDYQAALENAAADQKSLYEDEAKEIDRLQKEILKIANNEKPFDVFICYKESDESGKRTNDSVIANDIYHQLTQEGFKVFYAAITLEDKIGQAYEPYIFAALNSAKVMLVIGSKPEYFNAVWVKNEWSRYLKIIKNDPSKLLIPCYKDMDAYDLPEEFAHLQAQDMSKIGFINDVVRGIKKVVSAADNFQKSNVTVVADGSANAESLVDRALLAIEDSDIEKAEELLDKATDKAPKYAMIYVCRLLIELKLKNKSELASADESFEDSKNYQRAIQFADETLKKELQDYLSESIYQKATRYLNAAKIETEYLKAKELFESIHGYKDSAEKSTASAEYAETARKDSILNDANNKKGSSSVSQVEEALNLYEYIKGWKDADASADECKAKIEELKAEEARKAEENRIAAEIRKKKLKKAAIITTPIVIVLIALAIIYTTIISPAISYNEALKCLENNDYDTAYAMLEELGTFKDSTEILGKSRYDRATSLLEEKKYQEAYDMFVAAGNYSDAAEKANESYYNLGKVYLAEKNYDKSNPIFESLGNYKDSASLTHYHDYKVIKIVQATCTENGSETYKCDGCGDSYEKTLNATGHKFSPATCTEPAKCTKCGVTQGSALGHTSGGTTCSRCGAVTFKPLTFSGYGKKQITGINLPEGTYRSTCTYEGELVSFAIWLHPTITESIGGELLANEFTTSCTASEIFQGPIQDGWLDVGYCQGSWTIKIEAFN